MVRMAMAAGLALLWGSAQAEGARAYGSIGGWAYDISGSYTNTSELDLEDDLALKSTARSNYALGYAPTTFGWIPAVEFDYVRIAADGMQTFKIVPATAAAPLTNLLVPDTVVSDRTNINDFELTTRWPVKLGSFTLLGGFTVTHLNGTVTAADESNGQQMTQKINETFPLVSAGVDWQPVPSLRLSLSGDYITYQGNRADELEARVLWKFLGPIGLQGGYRQRRYKIKDAATKLDARVAGPHIGLVMEVPF